MNVTDILIFLALGGLVLSGVLITVGLTLWAIVNESVTLGHREEREGDL